VIEGNILFFRYLLFPVVLISLLLSSQRYALADDVNEFVVELQELLKKLKIGILRIEEADLEKMTFRLTVAEDLDCSGLPASDETICTYDEGFISGLLSEYTGKNFSTKEVDCWCSGDRVCRFEAQPAASA
jgi:predicted hydrocarbon binding protein